MKKVGILGGTFNPPHIGHLMMANEAYHALGLEEVRFMPNAVPPHKQSSGATDEQRKKMVELAIEDVPYFMLEMFELERGGLSYTSDTMSTLVQQEREVEFYFIIGGDSIDHLHTWHQIDDLVQIIKFVGIRRPGSDAITKYPVLMIDAPQIGLSSTLLRERFSLGKTVQYLLPKPVEAFIRKEGLYGARSLT
ncbi:nicotinate-nucleotide adenylyltransferase [Lysinibacillus odysseyi]|uniref:Probable nicotinate-nucleotide adenylyltransferase n=1 Tax=Lysinibacillus odysseyi 34hs-1 = NBRC 100172 TaxID=1220589 RepID=A0A0A3J8Y1_9BACI|nr:nicotinate-nucleotide adenylyltransferase [Lysinibacillus odysseyi]KGR83497.1 nicotinic acid mononucleotide adenylyltransferase [Lysinibacillus odysseyi 34hs-1 = NBRC 100172]